MSIEFKGSVALVNFMLRCKDLYPVGAELPTEDACATYMSHMHNVKYSKEQWSEEIYPLFILAAKVHDEMGTHDKEYFLDQVVDLVTLMMNQPVFLDPSYIPSDVGVFYQALEQEIAYQDVVFKFTLETDQNVSQIVIEPASITNPIVTEIQNALVNRVQCDHNFEACLDVLNDRLVLEYISY